MHKSKEYSYINRIILVIVLFVCCIFSSYSQNSVLNQRITFKTKNQSLYNVLNEISSQIGYEFSYNADLIQSSKKVKIDVDTLEIHKLLDQILNDSCLNYVVIDKQIVIHKKNTIGKLYSIKPYTTEDTIININGKIIDRETKECLPFASISISGRSIGTITNEDGIFTFKIPTKYKDENLVCTYIGYKNSTIPIAELSIHNNVIYMEQDFLSIQEVIIRSDNPETLIKSAMDNAKNNYYTKPFLLTAFYREFVIKNNKHVSILEAVLNVYKSPYEGYYSDQIKLIKSRKEINYAENDTFLLKLKGGLYASLYLDIIKNPTYFLLEKYFNLYTYSMVDIVKFDNSTAYVIEFKPKYYLEDKSFTGKLYIDTENLAIKSAQFFIDAEAIKSLTQELVLKKSMKTIVKPVSASYWVNYRQINDTYFLNLVRGELEFKVKKRKQLFSTNFKTIFEFAVNDIDTLDTDRFNRHDVLETNQIFTDKNFEYDHSFWGEYNYIIPDETLQDALIRISKQMKKLEEQ